jgi:hypothetical protein
MCSCGRQAACWTTDSQENGLRDVPSIADTLLASSIWTSWWD